MNVEQMLEEFKRLMPEERQRFMELADRVRQSAVWELRSGQPVWFRTRHATVRGTFVRMRQKYAEVTSRMDRHGVDRGVDITWSVDPKLLVAG